MFLHFINMLYLSLDVGVESHVCISANDIVQTPRYKVKFNVH